MDWMNQFSSLLNNPTVNSLAQSLIPKNKPAAPPQVAAPAPSVAAPAFVKASGMSTSTMAMIGGGVLALVAILFLALKKK